MSRRLDKTLADYVGIAISPVLIMAMVGSLVFFLLEVFYRGEYEGRLQVILALFVMATVLIGRISIDMGTEHASLYAGALGIVTALALFRLVEHGWLINVALLGLIWWSAHKLTWDCTLIDESEDASGEGLIQSTGLDKLIEKVKPKTAEPAPEESRQEAEPDAPQKKPDRRKAHAPGVWIVYFSLAALPMFGLGEVFVGDDPKRKGYTFFLLLVYVASGLGLLLTTSFLGLRRYLRQRKLQMPVSMAGSWIATGAAILVALLVLAALLPRPGTGRSPLELPIVLRSPERKASPLAFGRDGAKGRGAPGGRGPQDAKPPQASQSSAGGQQQPQDRSGSQPGRQRRGSQQSPSDQSSGRGQKGSPEQQSNAQSNQQSGQQGEGRSPEDQSSDGNRQQQAEQDSRDRQSKGQGQNKSSGDGQSDQSKRPSDKDSKNNSKGNSGGSSDSRQQQDDRQTTQDGSQPSQDQPPQESKPSEPPKSSWSMPQVSLGLSSGWLLALLRWILYIVLAVVVIIWLWKSREQVAAALRDFLKALRDLWASLFGGRKKEEEKAEAEQTAPTLPPPFASFIDPFTSGMVSRYSPEELVRYSFQALEAWAREHGCTRPLDQTAHEFARCVAGRAPSLTQGARNLAELYNQAAYAPGTVKPNQIEPLRQLWQLMQSAETVTQGA